MRVSYMNNPSPIKDTLTFDDVMRIISEETEYQDDLEPDKPLDFSDEVSGYEY